ncbi:MAG: cytochrome c, partial [Alphaproteobacteria bacterium]|nr:cytochrome c [Alphaproteobacteria bacterium]
MKSLIAFLLTAAIAIPAIAAEPMAGPRKIGQGVSIARGEQVFIELCANCHGMKGKGDGPRSTYFPEGQYIPDLTMSGFVQGRDEELLDAIRQGLNRLDEPLLIMPQFKYILSEDDIKSALKYVKTLAGPVE